MGWGGGWLVHVQYVKVTNSWVLVKIKYPRGFESTRHEVQTQVGGWDKGVDCTGLPPLDPHDLRTTGQEVR